MSNQRWIAFSAAAWLGSLAVPAFAEQVWQVRGGVTSISIADYMLRDLGLKMTQVRETATPLQKYEAPMGFGFAQNADMSVITTGGMFKEFSGGQVRSTGGFTVTGKKAFPLKEINLVPNGRFGWENLTVRSGTDRVFDVTAARIYFDRPKNKMTIIGADLTIANDLARKIGRPELTGQFVGTISIEADVVQTGGDAVDEYEQGGTTDTMHDVMLLSLGSLTQSGRVGTYPNGVIGAGMQTTSCNAGTNNLNWFAAMDTRHPVIAFNIYRLKDDRFEMISTSWLKHGWLATNSTSTGCLPCNSPGTGTMLGPGCSDTYGVGHNTDRDDLGPRNEINPFTGVWTCTGSYFSNYQPDCIKRNFGSTGLNDIDHKMQIRDQDLAVAGASYFYEAYYVTAANVSGGVDENKYNNLGSRRFTPVGGSTWAFNSQTDFVRGPTIERYGDVRNVAMPRASDGDAIVAVRLTFLGNGMYRYNYAVYNHDVSREIREFAVPVPAHAVVENPYYNDPDMNDAPTSGHNDWTYSRVGDKVSWSCPTFAENPNANSMTWGYMYTFTFDCNLPPTDSMAALNYFKPGVNDCLTVVTRVPGSTWLPTSVTTEQGDVFSGNRWSTFFDDNDRLAILNDAATMGTKVVITSAAPASTPVMKVLAEMSAARPGLAASLEMYNYTSSAYNFVGGAALGTSDQVLTGTAANTTDYIKTSDRETKARISTSPINDEDPAQDGWLINHDRLRWTYLN